MVAFPLPAMGDHLSLSDKFLIFVSLKVRGRKTVLNWKCVVRHINLPHTKSFERHGELHAEISGIADFAIELHRPRCRHYLQVPEIPVPTDPTHMSEAETFDCLLFI